MMKGKKISLLFIILLVFFSQKLTCEAPTINDVNLTGTTPSWVAVLGGNAITQPVRTSYGYIIPCEGRMLCAVTQSGALLWQKTFSQKMQGLVSIGLSDTVYVITKGNLLNMLNPSGTTLWTADAGFAITESPLPGRDGRVFVRGRKNLSCYGTHGIRRWKIDLDAQDTKLPLTELNDGSLLVFMEKKSEGKSIARRISPFGETSEEIIFAGKVEEASPCKDGVLLSFSDGSAGLCAVKENRAYSAWAIPQSTTGFKSSPRIITEGMKEGNAVFTGNQKTNQTAKIIRVETKDGKIISTCNTEINGDAIKYASSTIQGIVLADQTKAICLSEDNSISWRATFDKKKRWNKVYATDTGYLSLCTSAWCVEAYRVKQNLGENAHKSSFYPKEAKSYKEIYGTSKQLSSTLLGQAISSEEAEEILLDFKRGDFGKKEGPWLSVLDNEIKLLKQGSQQDSWDYTAEKNFFQTNLAYKETILKLASENGSVNYEKNIASLLKKTTDTSLLLVLIKNAGSLSLDCDGSLMASLEFVLQKRIDKKSAPLAQALCDSCYEIARYMGKPAFTKAQSILTHLLYPQYPSHIQSYARETLTKLGELGK